MKQHLASLTFALLLAAASVAHAAEPVPAAGGGAAGKATFKEFTVTKKTEAAQLAADHEHSADADAAVAASREDAQEAAAAGTGGGKASMKEFTVTRKVDPATSATADDVKTAPEAAVKQKGKP